MRRLPLALAILALLALPASAPAASKASVRLLACTAALQAPERAATFEARMRTSADSVRMRVRFTLQSHQPGGPWGRVAAEGLDTWLTSRARVRRYSYAKTVRNLAAPATYRTVVRFQWLDAEGSVLRRARHVSAVCPQPDLRPDLTPERVTVAAAADPAMARYTVRMRNTGRTVAGPFAVAFTPGADPPQTTTVAGLGIGERQSVTFVGRACTAGESLTVALDTAAQVDEREEADNVLVVPCAG
jgi:hypothetical protein